PPEIEDTTGMAGSYSPNRAGGVPRRRRREDLGDGDRSSRDRREKKRLSETTLHHRFEEMTQAFFLFHEICDL
ncbi:hypothetical protein ACJX0J_018844, partial [Zea mays]